MTAHATVAGKQKSTRKTLAILGVSQGFYLSAMSIDLTVTALAGAHLAPSPVLSTVPMATIAIGSVIVSPWVSRIMAKIGPKATFLIGAATAVIGGLCSFIAMTESIFFLLCVGTFAVGVYQSIANYYRYAAADTRPGQETRSVALVLSAGVVAAIIGPVIATLASHLFAVQFSGSYLAVSVLGLGAMLTLSLLPRGLAADKQRGVQAARAASPSHVRIADLFRRPRFTAGALLTLMGCFSMAIIMSGAPLELQYGLHTSDTMRMLAMQLHMAGMFGPMFILPLLAKYLSHAAQSIIGIGCGLIGLVIGLVGHAPQIAITLLLIGVAWAVTYATGSALLTTSYTTNEQSVARGVGEFFPVFGLAVGSLAAGPLMTEIGWNAVVIVCIVSLLIAGIFCGVARRSLA